MKRKQFKYVPINNLEKWAYHLNLLVIGCDESSISNYAGAIYGGVVILDYSKKYSKLIRDCKELNNVQLKKAFEEITSKCIAWAVGKTTAKTLDKIGTAKAIELAKVNALKNLFNQEKVKKYLKNLKKCFIISDWQVIKHPITCKKIQYSESNADQKYKCVAAASIIAKFTHDQEMINLDSKYPEFNWKSNKGSICQQHENFIIKFGLTPYHRRSWTDSIEKRREVRLKEYSR